MANNPYRLLYISNHVLLMSHNWRGFFQRFAARAETSPR